MTTRRPAHRLVTISALTGILAVTGLPGLPGAAADEGVSAIEVVGEVMLPEFPCPAPAGEEPCAGTITDTLADGSLRGRHDGNTWSIDVTALVELVGGTFSYGDHGPNPCLTGTASGTLHTADSFQVRGSYGSRSIVGVDITVDFSWERVGTKVAVGLHDAVVLANVDGLGWLELISTGQGVGGGTLFLSGLSGLPDCVFLDDTPSANAALVVSAAFTEDRPPSVPTLITPDPNTTPTFTFGQPTKFTVNATDPDSDPYTARITVADALTGEVVEAFESHLAPSGVDATGRPDDPLPPARYFWWAVAVDVRGAAGPQSTTGEFEVVPVSRVLDALQALPGI